MTPIFRSTSVVMKYDIQDQHRLIRGALPASVVAHLLMAALLIFGLPVSLLTPQENRAISVDLVPPPKPPEKNKAEPPRPQDRSQKPEEIKVEKPPPPGNDATRQVAAPVLRPVFQFGEKDAGPREALGGNSPEDGAASPMSRPDPDKQDLAEQSALPAAELKSQAPPLGAPETSAPKPTQPAKVQKASKPGETKTLFSQTATGESIAVTAMGDVPRGVRAGRLCVTELRDQLRNALPPYFPDLLPSYRLEEGTVIDVPRAAFRVGGEWYDLSYRCAVDTDATKVVSFAFRVGDVLSPIEWRRRGLPSQ